VHNQDILKFIIINSRTENAMTVLKLSVHVIGSANYQIMSILADLGHD